MLYTGNPLLTVCIQASKGDAFGEEKAACLVEDVELPCVIFFCLLFTFLRS